MTITARYLLGVLSLVALAGCGREQPQATTNPVVESAKAPGEPIAAHKRAPNFGKEISLPATPVALKVMLTWERPTDLASPPDSEYRPALDRLLSAQFLSDSTELREKQKSFFAELGDAIGKEGLKGRQRVVDAAIASNVPAAHAARARILALEGGTASALSYLADKAEQLTASSALNAALEILLSHPTPDEVNAYRVLGALSQVNRPVNAEDWRLFRAYSVQGLLRNEGGKFPLVRFQPASADDRYGTSMIALAEVNERMLADLESLQQRDQLSPKGEFETTEAFEVRRNAYEQQRSAQTGRYAAERDQLMRVFIQKRINELGFLGNLRVASLKYEADSETFTGVVTTPSLRAFNIPITLRVPLSQAASYKDQIERSKVRLVAEVTASNELVLRHISLVNSQILAYGNMKHPTGFFFGEDMKEFREADRARQKQEIAARLASPPVSSSPVETPQEASTQTVLAGDRAQQLAREIRRNMSPQFGCSQMADNIEQVADSTNLPLWHRVNTVTKMADSAAKMGCL